MEQIIMSYSHTMVRPRDIPMLDDKSSSAFGSLQTPPMFEMSPFTNSERHYFDNYRFPMTACDDVKKFWVDEEFYRDELESEAILNDLRKEKYPLTGNTRFEPTQDVANIKKDFINRRSSSSSLNTARCLLYAAPMTAENQANEYFNNPKAVEETLNTTKAFADKKGHRRSGALSISLEDKLKLSKTLFN